MHMIWFLLSLHKVMSISYLPSPYPTNKFFQQSSHFCPLQALFMEKHQDADSDQISRYGEMLKSCGHDVLKRVTAKDVD